MSSFADAGPDDDLRAAYLLSQVESHLEAGYRLLAAAKDATAKSTSEDEQQGESDGRAALAEFASALNWAEDGPDEERVHLEMDGAGRWVRETFGCHLRYEAGHYSQICPVALGHNRIGFSIGGVATRTCSLCGQDLSECEHRRGRSYMVSGGHEDLGWCRVCLVHEPCEHASDQTYRTGVVAIITEMAVDEVSVVSKPAHPDARLGSVSIPNSGLQETLGDRWSPGVPVSCDRCLLPCDGLTRHKIPHG